MLDDGDKIKKRLLDSCKAIAVVGLSDNSGALVTELPLTCRTKAIG